MATKSDWRAAFLALLLASGFLPVQAAASKVPASLPGGWVLDWHDEFNGKKLDPKKWKCELGVVRNQGASQAYSESCVKVKNGKLLLVSEAKKTPNVNYDPKSPWWGAKIKEQPYASGSVTTKGIEEFSAPGRLEFRAKIPKARGVWPAIWTMHVNKYRWPANGEIDILEHISQEPNHVYSLFRWAKPDMQREHKVVHITTIPDLSKAFHTYVLEWDAEIMRILIDDKEVGSIKIDEATYENGDNPLRSPCFLIMNTAIGGPGAWPESPVKSDYPVTFEIDYVRYYTKH